MKNVQIDFHACEHFSFTFVHKSPNHSVIVPQFFTIAIIPVIATATPAIIPIIGNNGTLNVFTAKATAAIVGATAVNTAINAPSITAKFCTGSGSFAKKSPTVFNPEAIGGMISFASLISCSPNGIRLCCNCLMLASNICESVVELSNIFFAASLTSL